VSYDILDRRLAAVVEAAVRMETRTARPPMVEAVVVKHISTKEVGERRRIANPDTGVTEPTAI
jgi:hypothetical protein